MVRSQAGWRSRAVRAAAYDAWSRNVAAQTNAWSGRTGSAGKVFSAGSVRHVATVVPRAVASSGCTSRASHEHVPWSGSCTQEVTTTHSSPVAAAPTAARGPGASAGCGGSVGRSSSTSSLSIIVALAAGPCCFQTGPP